MTEDSYIMRNKNGGKSQITKDQLDDVTCLKKEKSRRKGRLYDEIVKK